MGRGSCSGDHRQQSKEKKENHSLVAEFWAGLGKKDIKITQFMDLLRASELWELPGVSDNFTVTNTAGTAGLLVGAANQRFSPNKKFCSKLCRK